jgi:DNA-binding CsgD family transcriptional regulator
VARIEPQRRYDHPKKVGSRELAREADTCTVPHGPRARTALQDLVRHCHGGLDAPDLQRSLLHGLRRLVPADAAFFATADPQTLLFTGAFAEEPLGTATAQFLDNEYGGNDVNTFAALATSPTHVASLDSVTGGERVSSLRYREIMRPLGLGDELRVALVVGSQCWGYLCLHRTDDPSGFTEPELALVATAAPHLAHALRRAVLLHRPASAARGHDPGVVVLADDLSLVAVTPQASEFLARMEQRPSSLPLPVCVYAAAAALRAIEDGNAAPGTMPTTRVRTHDGQWLTVHASRLTGPTDEQRITIVIEEADAGSTMPLRLSAYGLSPREAEVATLVLRGTSTHAISATLHISEHTVQDHLKSVFDKIGVRSRRELVGAMLS